MKIVMIGSGYVGLVTGACFSEFGFDVTCVDIDTQKIENLKKGIIPIFEPGLDALVHKGIQTKQLSFTTQLKDVIHDADIVMVAVGTPSNGSDGQADLGYVFQAIEDITPHMNDYTVIVTKSTVPVGTGQKIVDLVHKLRPEYKEGVDFDVVSNPEFLREGSAIEDFMKPDRVVVGTTSPLAKKMMQKLYHPLHLMETPILITDRNTSELIKYAANGFLALKIAFINEMADLCEIVNGEVNDLAKGIGLDNRIGQKFLNAGPGFGGSCFPKDTRALATTAHSLNKPSLLIDSVIKSNELRKDALIERVKLEIKNKKKILNRQINVSILGITFKANTDDIREAISLKMIPSLLQEDVALKVYDPMYYQGSDRLDHLKHCADDWFNQVTFAISVNDAFQNADIVVFLTEWNEFRGLNLKKLYKTMAVSESQAVLVDYRNLFDKEDARDFRFVTIGRNI